MIGWPRGVGVVGGMLEAETTPTVRRPYPSPSLECQAAGSARSKVPGQAAGQALELADPWAASSPRTGACQPSWLTASNWPARPFGACRRPHGATPACRWRPRSPFTKVLVSSALLCGSHAWAPTPAQLQKLELVQRQHLRHTLRRPLARVACCSRADWCRPGGRGAHSWQRPAE